MTTVTAQLQTNELQFEQSDHFDDCCADISIIDDGRRTVAKLTSNGWSSIYGNQWMKLNDTDHIRRYQMRINKLCKPSEGLMYIGISSNSNHSNGRYTFYNDNKNYAFRSDGVIYHNSKYFCRSLSGFGTNDVVTFTINPFESQISFHKNGKLVTSQRYNTASPNQYKLAISLFSMHDSVSITNDDNVAAQIPTNHAASPCHSQRGSAKKHRSDASADIIASMAKQNESLNDEVRLLRQEMAALKQMNRKLRFENSSLKKQNKSLGDVFEHTASIKHWDAPQVVAWIMNLENGRYLKYFDMLNIRMSELGITGEKLFDLDYVDIKELGIIDLDDRKALYRQIQVLLAKHKHDGDETDEGLLNTPRLCPACRSRGSLSSSSVSISING
eukprot:CAMPEP_0197022902 /NCGR_PEP_ID=MMETSP1384-20130603/3700_1 /TAXON_ID=29189 /ORGANISM="Ammonia sp." /LENGTH=386 /DNA_ID=CAMNT_0042451023 /DNA_START=79 /DNA_END=1239 /DNA_ORIENTATION=+